MYALTYSKDSINSNILAWKKSREPAIPNGNLLWVFSPREDDRVGLECIWIQSNGVIAHVEIKGCCKSEIFDLLQ